MVRIRGVLSGVYAGVILVWFSGWVSVLNPASETHFERLKIRNRTVRNRATIFNGGLLTSESATGKANIPRLFLLANLLSRSTERQT